MSIYTLDESDPDSLLSSTSSWCQRGYVAVLQPVMEQEELDGVLCRAQWVLCTWAEEDVLRPGCMYVVKSFHEEVVHQWQAEFPNSTTLQLCLRVRMTTVYIMMYYPAIMSSSISVCSVYCSEENKTLLLV